MEEGILLRGGKYYFYKSSDGSLYCKRYGEDWRGFIGDNAVSVLFDYGKALEEYVPEAVIKRIGEEY